MKKIVASLIIMAMYATEACAQETEVYSNVKMEEYVVTPSKGLKPLKDISLPVKIVTKEEIELSGAVNLGDLLGKYLTGHLHKYNGLSTVPGIRGFRADSMGDDIKGHVLVLVDGHRLGTGNMAKISLDRIETVEIIKGPVSALYGSAAMGGVINLITKKGAGDFFAEIKGELGSFAYQKESFNAGGNINDQLSFHASFSYEDIDNYKDPEYGEAYNSAQTQKNFGGNITYQPSQDISFRLGGNFAENEGEYPSWNNWMTYSSYLKNNSDYYKKDHSYLDFECNTSFLDKTLFSKTLLYYLKDINDWYYGTYPNPDQSFGKNEDKTKGFDQQFTIKKTDNHEIVLGFSIEKLEKNNKSKSYGFSVTPSTPSMEYESKAVYFQESLDLLDNKLNISFGGRYDNFSLSTKKSSGSIYSSFIENEEDFDHLSPKLGVSYKLSDQSRIKFNIGKGFRTPSADQLSAEYQVYSWGSYLRTLGNSDLDPETSVTFDIGFNFENTLCDLEFIFFNTDFKDRIQAASKMVYYKGEYWTTWENGGKSEIQGIDLNYILKLGSIFGIDSKLDFYSNTTFNLKYEDKETGNDIQYISDYESKTGLRFSSDKLLLELAYILIGPQKERNFDVWSYVAIEKRDSFDFVDLSLKWQLTDNISTYVFVNNILDEQIEWTRGYIMSEINYKVGTKIKF